MQEIMHFIKPGQAGKIMNYEFLGFGLKLQVISKSVY
jgi:hypothetical protein